MASRIDIAEIQKAALRSIPLTFRLTSLPHESHALLDRILEVYLAELGQEQILEPLSYCLKELIINAQKANTKRVYFEEKGLDLNDRAQYEKGMEEFRRESAERMDHWISRLKERKLSIAVTFHSTGSHLTIAVRNAVELSQKEQMRIFDRIARARAFGSFVEALSTPLDSSEGAGLGIMILMQFLKRIGLGEEAFSIESQNGETVAAVSIPMNRVHLQKISVLTTAIVRDVDSLPHFPDAVLRLIRLTEEPSSSVAQIAGEIATDPAVTADLLKLANSARYVLPQRVNNILQAVRIVGTRGLRNLLYSYGAHEILAEKFTEMETLWARSNRAAYYSYLMARSLKRKEDILDDAYVAGLLSDLGLIIVTYLHPQAMEKMTRFCKEKDIPVRILERFSFGQNHAELGALMARKWNFPEQLVQGIQLHHDPLLSPVPYKDVVFSVYLGVALCDLEDDLASYDQMERPVLHEFGIQDEQQCRRVLERLQMAFGQRRPPT